MKAIRNSAVAAFATVVFSAVLAPTGYAQSLSFSAGSSCGGATSANFTPGGPAITVSVCASAPNPTCGATIQLQSTLAQSDTFRLTGRTRGAAFDTDNALSVSFGAGTITNPLNIQDLGATNATPVPAASGVVVATLAITPPAVAPDASYVVTLGGLSSLTSTTGVCDITVTETQSTGATFTFNKTVAAATAQFTISTPVNVTEGGAAANAVVTCTGALDGSNTPITVPYTLTNAAGNFTTAPASPLTFNACPSTQNIAVTPRAADATAQGNVSGSIVLGAPSAGSLGAASTSTVNVADSPAQTVTVAVSPSSATEEGGVLTYTFTRSGTAPQIAAALAVNITPPAASTRYTTTCTSPINFAAAATTATCTVTGVGNTTADGNVNVAVAVASGSGYTVGTPGSATGTITDDDGPQTVTIAVSPASVAENSGTPLVYTVTRSGGSAGQLAAPLTVSLTGTGTAATARYSTTCGATLTIAASATTATCSVTPIDNAVLDGNVTAVVTIANNAAYTTGTPSSATGTITDDEVAVNAVAGSTGSATSMTITEGGIASFSVACPTLTAAAQTVNYSITPATPATGDTFVGGGATGTVTCPAAAASLVPIPTTVQTIDDTVIGNSRVYSVTISLSGNSTGVVIGNASAQVLVQDNDQAVVVPTMGAAGLALMSLMLAGLAALQRRRRG